MLPWGRTSLQAFFVIKKKNEGELDLVRPGAPDPLENKKQKKNSLEGKKDRIHLLFYFPEECKEGPSFSFLLLK